MSKTFYFETDTFIKTVRMGGGNKQNQRTKGNVKVIAASDKFHYIQKVNRFDSGLFLLKETLLLEKGIWWLTHSLSDHFSV